MPLNCLTAICIAGLALVHDGDTIRVSGQSIRLQGVDAEELTEPNGPAATTAMRQIVGDKVITCTVEGRSYNRIVGTCYLPDGTNINREIIRLGFALDCAHYSHGKYRLDEPAGARERLIQKPYCGDRHGTHER